jgi:hypothetical protein
LYFGDAQNQIRSLWSRIILEANQHAPRAATRGDLVGAENGDDEWGEWFGAGGWPHLFHHGLGHSRARNCPRKRAMPLRTLEDRGYDATSIAWTRTSRGFALSSHRCGCM